MNQFDFMDSYPSLAVLIQILATLQVTTATNEPRSVPLNI